MGMPLRVALPLRAFAPLREIFLHPSCGPPPANQPLAIGGPGGHRCARIGHEGTNDAATDFAGFLGSGRRCRRIARSGEHTSELQSLMRISYAVFCLQKKKNTNK